MARESMGLTKINFYLDPKVLTGLKWLATSRNTTYSELIRQATKKFLVEELDREQSDIAVMSKLEVVDG